MNHADTTRQLLAMDPDTRYRLQMAQLAREARNTAARYYRRGRKCTADARRCDQAAKMAASSAAFYERHAAQPAGADAGVDEDFRQLCAQRAPEYRESAATWERLAAHEREQAPRWRQRGAEAMKRAREFQRYADGRAAQPIDYEPAADAAGGH
jgi:hypothetical protein